MFRSKRQQEILESTESKLAKMLGEMNEEKRPDDGRIVCETECTMARIRSFSDFMYLMKVRPLQTACYYAAAVLFLLMLAAFWCSEWLLGAVFAVFFIICATLPHNMRIQYFNKRADKLENSFGRIFSADLTAEDKIVLTISEPREAEQDNAGRQESTARVSEALRDSGARVVEIPYKNICRAYECSHSFYLFPDMDGEKLDALICDKTQFICGTPMQMRDRLARGCGKRFRIRIKKA